MQRLVICEAVKILSDGVGGKSMLFLEILLDWENRIIAFRRKFSQY